ncbi:hypothetical protein EJ08DRAFT_269708 [Tothia fuscella]|uniref:DUF7730 domain-containing protein n=1 Tax=Tothia fuscella TaxID=1048955 RepID=A0A9P4NQ35_9PEZI|nr:hypothetical protein EJ08DRAFT_269708 [Tothia fuscella]
MINHSDKHNSLSCFFLPKRRRDISTTPSKSLLDKLLNHTPPQNPQLHCLLFRLPRELRDEIYTELHGEPGTFHIVDTNNTIHSIRYPSTPDADRPYHLQQIAGITIPFLQTCRRIHDEIMQFIYGRNTFTFAKSLLSFAGMIPQTNLALIRTVTINWDIGATLPHRVSTTPPPVQSHRSYIRAEPSTRRHAYLPQLWDPTCKVLATQMPNLRDLSIEISIEENQLGELGIEGYQEMFLVALGGLRGLRKLDLAFEVVAEEVEVRKWGFKQREKELEMKEKKVEEVAARVKRVLLCSKPDPKYERENCNVM